MGRGGPGGGADLKRAVTDPKAIALPAYPRAKPVPVEDLGFSRGLLSAAWSADGKRVAAT